MKNYHNKKALIKIGNNIKRLRKSKELEIEDIAEMTGITSNTIRAIENGRESNISFIIEIAFAMGVHPREIFNIDFNIKPRYKLSAKRKEKSRLTSRINKLVEADYFYEPKFAKDVCQFLSNEYKIKTTSPSVSVILLRLKKNGILSSIKQGRQNLYVKK